ncbi:ABC transporter ATP-binding protein, partial [Escherichia coli]|nr:ABC transporter ATP-binding protein [Escherichia coli]
EVQVTSLVERIYFNLRRRINIISSPEIRDLFNPRRFYALAKNDLYNTLHDREMFIRNLVDKNELSELVADSCYDYLRKIHELMIEP